VVFRVRSVSQRIRTGCFLCLAACAAFLAGCTPEYNDAVYGTDSTAATRSARARPKIAVPDRALLVAPAEPDCGTATAQQVSDRDRTRVARYGSETTPADGADERTAAAGTSESARVDPNADLALRIKLEYERECFRQAEMRVRDRLKQLQTSTAQTIKTIKSAEQSVR
jgi:hypothetical protein